MPSGVHVVDTVAVDKEKQKVSATLGRNQRESVVAADEGYYLDVLQGRLRQVVGEHMSMRRDAGSISLDIPGRMTMEASNARLDAATASILSKVGSALAEYHATLVTVQVFNESAPGMQPSALPPSATAVVQRLVQEGAASTHMFVVTPEGAQGAHPPDNRNLPPSTAIRIALTVQPIAQTQTR